MRRVSLVIPAAVVALVLSSAIQAYAGGAGAELPGLDFDQGIDASDVLKVAREKAADSKVAKDVAVRPLYRRYERDCVNFTIGANDAPQTEAVWLRSTEWVEECHPTGPNGSQTCYERPGMTYRERAQITIRDRQTLFPWEYDSFDVCLEGPWLNIWSRETAYEYKTVQGGSYNGNFVLVPVKKIQMKPDPAGIVAQSFTPRMAFAARDKWVSYYAGETTVLALKLRKSVPGWFDATLLEKELSFAAAETYTVDFMAYAKEFSQKLEAGKPYYVEYSFKRIGKISKDKLMKVGESDKAVYQSAPAALGR
ncbi:MAG: hypothetical protein HY748_02970 [Elusimicrobia bacterium]|nr:hypothetical protein [Elusimicrobiota bacterium]